MGVTVTPISSDADLPTAINTMNKMIRSLSAENQTKTISQAGGSAMVSGLQENGTYGEVLYDSNGVPRILIGQKTTGDPIIAMSGSGKNVTTSTPVYTLGRIKGARYGQIFYDNTSIPRMVIGQDDNGDPTIALSSGSNSVLDSGNERFKISNIGSNYYAQVISDSSNVPRIIQGQSPVDGEPVLAITKSGYNVLTELQS